MRLFNSSIPNIKRKGNLIFIIRSGIIYCCTIKDCEDISNKLNSNYKLKCAYYHGSMAVKERSEV